MHKQGVSPNTPIVPETPVTTEKKRKLPENLGRNAGIGAVVLGVPYLGYRFVKGGIGNVFGLGGDILDGGIGIAQTIGGGLIDGVSFLGKDLLYEGVIKTGLVDGLYGTVLKDGLYETVLKDFAYETVVKDIWQETIIKDGIIGGSTTSYNYVTGGGLIDDGGSVINTGANAVGSVVDTINPFKW